MRYFFTFLIPFVATFTLAGCGSDPIDTPTTPTEPTQITETFSGTLNVNGARTHNFTVDRAGQVSAQLKTLSDQAATVGVSLGTWNGQSCAIIITNTSAVLNTTVIGTASSLGQFCVWLNDVGKLTAGVDYSVDVIHY
jgi:hypothetical protein